MIIKKHNIKENILNKRNKVISGRNNQPTFYITYEFLWASLQMYEYYYANGVVSSIN